MDGDMGRRPQGLCMDCNLVVGAGTVSLMNMRQNTGSQSVLSKCGSHTARLVRPGQGEAALLRGDREQLWGAGGPPGWHLLHHVHLPGTFTLHNTMNTSTRLKQDGRHR